MYLFVFRYVFPKFFGRFYLTNGGSLRLSQTATAVVRLFWCRSQLLHFEASPTPHSLTFNTRPLRFHPPMARWRSGRSHLEVVAGRVPQVSRNGHVAVGHCGCTLFSLIRLFLTLWTRQQGGVSLLQGLEVQF